MENNENVKQNKVLEYLNRPLRTFEYTQDQLKIVYNLMEPGDIQHFTGAKADGIVKALANKYKAYCKDVIKFTELLAILYTIITEKKCEVSYTVAAAVDEAQEMRRADFNKYPLEFYLSETLECVISAPDSFKVFAKDEEDTGFTLRSAIEGIIGRELVFPSDTNKVVAYPDTDYYLAYVSEGNRWLAVLAGDIAGKITSYNNPIVYTPKGLMQGDILLRFLNGRDGVVRDDYIIV